jgi:hypothetical protein
MPDARYAFRLIEFVAGTLALLNVVKLARGLKVRPVRLIDSIP